MAKVIRCKDTGMDCNWVGRADTEEELFKKAAQHLKEAHNVEPSPEMMETARKLVHDE
jgi:predicted small metal-binding protein